MHKSAYRPSLLKTIGGAIGGGLLAEGENQLLLEDADPKLQRINNVMGALTGGIAASGHVLPALGALTSKQLGLFGIKTMDDFVDLQVPKAKLDLEAATMNRDAARAILGGLITAGVGAVGYGGLKAYQAHQDRKKKKDRPATRTPKSKLKPDSLRIEIPSSKISDQFYNRLSRELLFDTPDEKKLRALELLGASDPQAARLLETTQAMKTASMTRADRLHYIKHLVESLQHPVAKQAGVMGNPVPMPSSSSGPITGQLAAAKNQTAAQQDQRGNPMQPPPILPGSMLTRSSGDPVAEAQSRASMQQPVAPEPTASAPDNAKAQQAALKAQQEAMRAKLDAEAARKELEYSKMEGRLEANRERVKGELQHFADVQQHKVDESRMRQLSQPTLPDTSQKSFLAAKTKQLQDRTQKLASWKL